MYNRNLLRLFASIESADSTTLRLRSGQARIHLELIKPLLNQKLMYMNPLPDGYTKPLCNISKTKR